MSVYWIVGGIYASTRFDKLAKGASEERYGPFPTYDMAMDDWMSLSWRQVDNCNCRYRIVEEEPVS